MVEQAYTYAVGRRKTAVAQVRLYYDAGPVVVDDRLMEEAFPYSIWQHASNTDLLITNRCLLSCEVNPDDRNVIAV